MSLDLLAAFDDTASTTPQSTTQSATAKQYNDAFLSQPAGVDEDDDFGDFEDAGNLQPVVVPEPHSGETTARPAPVAEGSPHHSSSASSQRPTTQSNGKSKGYQPSKSPLPPKEPAQDSRIGRHPFADHMDVLFAADEDEYNAGEDELTDLANNPEAAMAYSKRIIQEQLDAEAAQAKTAIPDGGQLISHPEAILEGAGPSEVVLKPRNLDILFDASDLSDEPPEDDTGDWGDFEGIKEPVSNGTQETGVATVPGGNSRSETVRPDAMPATFDLLGLDEPQQSSPKQPAAKSDLKQKPATGLVPRQTIARSPASFNAIIERGFTDAAWDDFEDTVPAAAVSANAEAVRKASVTAIAATLPRVPPANVPPPSIIVSAFPDLLKQSIDQHSVMDRMSVSNVLAHVIAGRKHRWKRSSSLAASMRIGPSAIGGKGGMKLTGLDRTEVAKEDREVAEVLSVWRAQLGRFRSAYAAYTGSATSEDRLMQAKLPEVNDPAPVKVLKPQEGGLVAPHECALCGLKRQERIVGIDDNVDDSFGEWWTEGADMHTACALWWVKHEALLRSK